MPRAYEIRFEKKTNLSSSSGTNRKKVVIEFSTAQMYRYFQVIIFDDPFSSSRIKPFVYPVGLKVIR